MANTTKKQSRSKKSGPRKHKPAIVEISAGLPEEASTTLDSDAVRREITRRVTGQAIALVDCMMQHIKDGNFQAMKYLFEAVGLLPIKIEETQPVRHELGKKLSDLLDGNVDPEGETLVPDSEVSSLAVK